MAPLDNCRRRVFRRPGRRGYVEAVLRADLTGSLSDHFKFKRARATTWAALKLAEDQLPRWSPILLLVDRFVRSGRRPPRLAE